VPLGRYGAGMEWSTPRRPVRLPPGFIEPCNPTFSAKAPSGRQWVHEIKHDGYRLVVRKDGRRVRLFTRRGFDWTERYPAIRIALRMLRVRSATIDGEAVCCGEDGIPDFDKLHSHAYNDDVFLYAFDLLELNGDDLRKEPLEKRKSRLEKLNGGWGLRFVEHMNGDGPTIFEHACRMKLEGIVSKRKDSGYRSGPSKSWLKTKNPTSPAMFRVIEEGVW
jgi:bifunctional non-homologous end joining protein LigD